jgi:hypothetical protein
MIVKDLLEYCIEKANLGKPNEIDSQVYAFALKALNSVAEEVWKSYSWVNSKLIGLTVTTDTAVINLPKYVYFVKAVRMGSSNIQNADEILLSVQDPDLMDGNGNGESLKFINLPYVSVMRQPNELSAITFRSTHTADKGKILKVQGLETDVLQDGGQNLRGITERIILDGIDTVFATRNYDIITGISKEATTGRIYVEDEDGNILATIEPAEDRSSFKQIKIMPFEEGVENDIQILAKRKFLPLVDDYDVFPVDRAEGAIKNLLIAELLEYDQKLEQAATYRQKAMDSFNNSVEDEKGRQFQEMRVIPSNPMFSEVGTI